MSNNQRNNRMIRQVMYQLRKQYGGGPVDIYKFNGSTTDIKTGVATVDKELIRAQRAIILPARVERTFVQSISRISADKQFVYGGTYDRSRRMFLVDRRNINCEFSTDLQLTHDDWIVYNGHKYEIKHFDEFEFESIWIIVGHRVLGDSPELIHPECAEDRLTVGEDADGFI